LLSLFIECIMYYSEYDSKSRIYHRHSQGRGTRGATAPSPKIPRLAEPPKIRIEFVFNRKTHLTVICIAYKQLKCCHEMRFWEPKMRKNAFAAGAPSRTHWGRLQRSPRPTSWIWGEWRRERKREKGGALGVPLQDKFLATRMGYIYLCVNQIISVRHMWCSLAVFSRRWNYKTYLPYLTLLLYIARHWLPAFSNKDWRLLLALTL